MSLHDPAGPHYTPRDYKAAQARYDELWPLMQLVAISESREEFLLLEGRASGRGYWHWGGSEGYCVASQGLCAASYNA